MKILIAAALLLALVGPVHAFDFAAHCDTHGCDTKPSEKDLRWQPTIEQYMQASGACRNTPDEQAPVCVAETKLGKKLEAHGYCLYGRGGVGHASRGGRHCYKFHD